MPSNPNDSIDVSKATSNVLEHRNLTIICSDFMERLTQIVGCKRARLFEKRAGQGWKELGHAENGKPQATSAVDSTSSESETGPYPEQFFAYLEQTGQLSGEYISYETNEAQELFDTHSMRYLSLDADYFRQAQNRSLYIVPVAHKDHSMWLLYLEDDRKFFFKSQLEHVRSVFVSALRLQLWRLKELLDAKVVEFEDKNIIHETRNAVQAMQGAIQLILDVCKDLMELAKQISDTGKQRQLIASINKIFDIAKELSTDLDTDIEHLQSSLNRISADLKISPDTLRRRSTASPAMKTEFNVSKSVSLWIQEMSLSAQKKNKTIQLQINPSLEAVICRGYADKLKKILCNLTNNAIEHGAFGDTILVIVDEKSDSGSEKIEVDISILNKLPRTDDASLSSSQPRRSGSGLGMQNIRSDLSYFENSSMQYGKLEDSYIVSLKL